MSAAKCTMATHFRQEVHFAALMQLLRCPSSAGPKRCPLENPPKLPAKIGEPPSPIPGAEKILSALARADAQCPT